jgi:hypothetical protein
VALSQLEWLRKQTGIDTFSIWLKLTSDLSYVASQGFKMSVVVWTPKVVVG